MVENFLTDILKVVILLDVLGVIAYFLLGAVRPKLKPIEPLGGLCDKAPDSSNSLWEKLSSTNRRPLVTPLRRVFGRFGRLSPKRLLASGRQGSRESLEEARSNLRRVLNSFREGLV